MINTVSYRRFLGGSALISFLLFIVFVPFQIATGSSAITATLYPLSLALTLLLALVGNLLAWQRGDADWLLRLPLLAAPLLLVAHAGLSYTLGFPPAGFAEAAGRGIALLALAAFIVPALAGLLPQPTAPARLGARANAHARRYRSLAIALSAGIWLMAAGGSWLAAEHNNALLNLFHRSNGALIGVLLVALLWQTWRERRHDQVLTRMAAVVAVLFASQIASDLLHWFSGRGPLTAGLHLIIATMLWCASVAMAVLALRRPAPTLPAPAARPQASQKQPSLISDYMSLTKPKVISLLLLTTLAAMYITGQGQPGLALVFWTMLGGYLAAGGAGAINCAFDEDIDINMGRTSRRPVPAGRISRRNAMAFGLSLTIAAVAVLWFFTTPLAALFAAIGAVYYALFYTRWLKRGTWQNIVIGGGAGSIPPLVGWTAVTGTLDMAAVLLFVIIFYWTPPHFWALALVKQQDYARAGVPMLPVVAGEAETNYQILLYSVLMFAVSLLLVPIGAMGAIYLISALLLGGLFLRYAWRMWRGEGQAAIWGMYKYSLLYLALLFAAMVADRLILA
jgi:protoheme IX farnesyltransferase